MLELDAIGGQPDVLRRNGAGQRAARHRGRAGAVQMRREKFFTRLMLAALLGSWRWRRRRAAARARRCCRRARPTSSRASIRSRPTRRRACSATRAGLHDSFPLFGASCTSSRFRCGASRKRSARRSMLFQRRAGRPLPGLCRRRSARSAWHLLFAEGHSTRRSSAPSPSSAPAPTCLGGRAASRAEGRRARRQDRVRRRRQDRAGDGSGARRRHPPVQCRVAATSWSAERRGAARWA